MILSFINIRKVPREMLKTLGFALGFQHLPRDLVNVNEWKIMFDPYSNAQIVCVTSLLFYANDLSKKIAIAKNFSCHQSRIEDRKFSK